ncbi:MAG: hypothetical protein A2V70_19000 [Planctomycetes bacterium RBG_13_63_9]|nr:MAG: hypothetical protein A2V70_19000 [Planctomycetes bacterium RBG_13_63_9]
MAWGENWEGETDVPAGNDFVAVDGGWAYSVALKQDGSLIAWGGGLHGTLNVPAGNDYVAISAADYTGLALKEDGSVAGWGWITRPPPGNNVVSVAAGSRFGLLLKQDGSLGAWGDRYFAYEPLPEGNRFVAIACGREHSLAIEVPEPSTAVSLLGIAAGCTLLVWRRKRGRSDFNRRRSQ